MTHEAETSTQAVPGLVVATKEIVTAYVSHNNLSDDKIGQLIENVFTSLLKIAGGPTTAVKEPVPQEPAIPVRRSVTDDYIVCLEDGKRLKVMTRYLRTKHDMSPEEYRAKWNLPHDYPMTAPGYSKKRSDMALAMDFGKKRKKTVGRAGEQLTLEAA